MSTATAWLPANATSPSLDARLAEAVERWSQQWFARERFAAGGFARAPDPRWELRVESWWNCGGDVALALPAGGAAMLGAMAAGIDPHAVRPEVDATLLARVGDECLADLRHRLGAVAGLRPDAKWTCSESRPARGGSPYRAEIAGGTARVLLALELPEARYFELLKDALPTPAAEAPLSDAVDALAVQPVHLAALLGRCELTLAELSGLAPGDVVVLDQPLDGPLGLAVEGVHARRGACTVARRECAMDLEITEALAG